MSDNRDWVDTNALIGWLLIDPFAGDEVEVITLTEAGRAALASAEAEDTALAELIEQRNFWGREARD